MTTTHPRSSFPDKAMNQEKLAKLQAQVRIGGKVTTIISTVKIYIFVMTQA